MDDKNVTPGMELKDFISQTMQAILEAVDDAREHAEKRDRKIYYGPTIDFDVSLTVIQGENGKKGIGVFSAVLNAGLATEDTSSTQSVGRSVGSSFDIRYFLKTQRRCCKPQEQPDNERHSRKA
jgi:hypothetical protein